MVVCHASESLHDDMKSTIVIELVLSTKRIALYVLFD